MTKIEEKFKIIRDYCETNANPDIVRKYARFFTEGYDAYGLDRDAFESQRDKWLKLWENELILDDYILLGDKLVSTGKYEEASFAIGFLAAMKDRLSADYFELIGNWLENGIVNWGHTDALSGLVLSHFITKKIIEIESFNEWTTSASKWKRRSVPVTLIDALKVDIPLERMMAVIEPLMPDKDKFAQKGLGWFLREAWEKYPEKTEDFLLKWKDTCGRTIIQYATEKMDREYKSKFKRGVASPTQDAT
jgi:3-methyladenine DNA glycosylase AlkD